MVRERSLGCAAHSACSSYTITQVFYNASHVVSFKRQLFCPPGSVVVPLHSLMEGTAIASARRLTSSI